MNDQKKIIPSEHILTAVNGLGQVITNYCHKHGGGIVFVCIMKGGFMFFSDLIKKVHYPIEVDFIRCSSYDGQQQQDLTIHSDIESDIKDKTVFLVDDILDTGNTMKALVKHFKNLGAKQVETVSAVYKKMWIFPIIFIYTNNQKELIPGILDMGWMVQRDIVEI